MARGKLIVLEGSEGCGKSSQLKKLAEVFGDQVIISREPGGTPYAEEIRNVILHSDHASQANAKTHFGLFWAARADHIKNKISPALEAGKMVILDRFDSSTYAYQIYGQQAEELKGDFFTFRDFFLGDCKPDLYIYLDVDIEEGLKRKQVNQEDELNHFDKRKIDFYDRMKQGYADFFAQVPHIVVDANPDFDTVHESILKVISDIG